MSEGCVAESIPEGYKQTEVGVIPEDWNIHILQSCLLAPPDYGINAPAVPFSDKLPVYIRITDITENGRFTPDKLVSVKHVDADRYYLKDGDIVFARTGASVGKSYLYDPKDGELVFAGFLIRVRTDATKLIPAYIAEYVKTGAYWNWVRIMSMRSGQPGINGNEYGQLPISLPPTITEQEVIAEALSDTDALIESLEQLIAKKRQIKQGAMQELLTGKRRLPGFEIKVGYKQTEVGMIPEDWEIEEFNSCLELLTDFEANGSFESVAQNVRVYNSEKYAWYVRATDIENRTDSSKVKYVDFKSYNFLKKTKLFGSEVLITKRGEIGKVYYFEKKTEMATLGPNLYLLKLKNKVNPYYIYCYFKYGFGNKQLVENNASTTLGALYKDDVKSMLIPLPSTKSEQNAIATIFSDMDTEIAALEEKLAKTRNLKQGMMQELLTGRIRLI